MAVEGKHERAPLRVSPPDREPDQERAGRRDRQEGEPQVTSVRLPAELRNRLDGLADVFKRPRNDLIIAVLERYVDEGWSLFADVEEGRRDVRAGRVVSPDDVWARLRQGGLVGPAASSQSRPAGTV